MNERIVDGGERGFKDMFLLPEQVAIPKMLLSPSASTYGGFISTCFYCCSRFYFARLRLCIRGSKRWQRKAFSKLSCSCLGFVFFSLSSRGGLTVYSV